MKKFLKLFSSIIVLMFAFSLNARAMDNITKEDDLVACLEGTDAVCKIASDALTLNNSVEIKSDKTLDLNSKTLTTKDTIVVGNAELTITGSGKVFTKDADPMFLVKVGSTLTVDKATLESTTYYGATVKVLGEITDNNVKTKLIVKDDAELIGNYVISISNDGKSSSYGTQIDVYGTLTGINNNNGWTKGSIGINLSGNTKTKTGNVPEINVYDSAKIEATDGPAIYAGGYGIWNISGGSFTGTEALSIKAGIFDITGGSFTATGAYVSPKQVQANGNGSEATGAAISVTGNDGYANGVELSIFNATVESKNGYAVFEGITKGSNPAVKDIQIYSGDFTGKEGAVYAENEKNFIQGGQYNTAVNEYLAEDVKITTENGSYVASAKYVIIVAKPENGTVSVDEKAYPGDIVKLDIKPNEGYKVSSIKVSDFFDKDVNVTDNSFVMPDSPTYVEVSFVKEEVTESSKTEPNPNTSDNIIFYVGLCLVTLVGLGFVIKRFSKQIN